MAKEMVILSGKGGTGKTSLSASFAMLAEKPVIADCDVDAANLHLLLDAKVEQEEPFVSGHVAVIDESRCTGCGRCIRRCRYDAISRDGRVYVVDPIRCEGCGSCVDVCSRHAIDFPESECGQWMVSTTKAGPMVHAHLHPGAENSGKLVTLVRKEAAALAERSRRTTIISDGPPGIGCPVIASMTNADLVVLVAEPSASAIHDLERVIELVGSFHIPMIGCINKASIDIGLSDDIKALFKKSEIAYAGSVDYDEQIVKAQTLGLSPIEFVKEPTATQITHIWESIWNMM